MEKKYQVFISSTYEDLREERSEVMKTVLQQECIPVCMEVFPSSNDEVFEYIKKTINQCDYYVLILGSKYGSVASDGLSYTEKEYRYARDKNIPIIGFCLDESLVDYDNMKRGTKGKYKKFRKLVLDKMTPPWKTKDELSKQVANSLPKLIEKHPSTGWIRISRDNETLEEELRTLKEKFTEIGIRNFESDKLYKEEDYNKLWGGFWGGNVFSTSDESKKKTRPSKASSKESSAEKELFQDELPRKLSNLEIDINERGLATLIGDIRFLDDGEWFSGKFKARGITGNEPSGYLRLGYRVDVKNKYDDHHKLFAKGVGILSISGNNKEINGLLYSLRGSTPSEIKTMRIGLERARSVGTKGNSSV